MTVYIKILRVILVMKLVELLIDRRTVMLILKSESVISKDSNYRLYRKLVQLMKAFVVKVSKMSNMDSLFGLVSV